jgi:hypothetical protein
MLIRALMEFDNFRGKRLLEIGCGLGTDKGVFVIDSVDP